MKKITIVFAFIFSINYLIGQQHSHSGASALSYPNIKGYITLKTDLHMHSVFSDGSVWPTIRVQEALRENLDAISLTEHLEYQPHAADIPHPDRNRAFELAFEEAKEHDLLIVPGSEITRSAPVGHSNAIFISDANTLMEKNADKAFAAAKKQKAFVFWNHPAWHAQSATGNPVLSDFQKERINEGELHGIEVINTVDYSKESLALALENDLTIMGTSDIHGLIDWDYTEKGKHRPITLVFAKEKSNESLRKALFAGRTVAVYNSLLVGKEEFLKPLLQQSVEIKNVHYLKGTQVLSVDLKNVSSSDLLFENAMDYNFYSKSPVFTIAAGTTETLQIKTLDIKSEFVLQLKALGAFTAPDVSPVVDWPLTIK